MNDCVMTEVRDALPDLVHGRLNELDTATMTAHVESCADCRAELALLREVRDSAPLAPAMDAARIASLLPPYGGAAVIRNLPAPPARKSAWGFALLAASAAVAVGLGGIAINSRGTPADEIAPRVAATAPAVASAIPAASAVVPSAPAQTAVKEPVRVATKAVEMQVASLSLVGGTQDLSEAQLETLLAELDGMESIPSAEPQSVTLSVEDIEGGQ